MRVTVCYYISSIHILWLKMSRKQAYYRIIINIFKLAAVGIFFIIVASKNGINSSITIKTTSKKSY